MSGWREVAQVMLGSWPGQVGGWSPTQMTAYVSELQRREVEADEAIVALRASTSEFPPSAGALVAGVERRRQGPPPDFMTTMRLLAQHVTLLDYHNPASTFDAYIARLAGHHEAVARYAVAAGPRGVREMPDPAQAQDASGSVALTRNEQSYRQTTRGWEEDPTPGLALVEATRLTIAARARHELESMSMAELVEGDEQS